MADYLLLSDDIKVDLIARILEKGLETNKTHTSYNISKAVESLDLPEWITAEDAASLEEFLEF